MNSPSSKKRIIDNDSSDEIIEINNNLKKRKNGEFQGNLKNFLYKFFNKDYVDEAKYLLSKLIDFTSLSDHIIYSLVYFFIRYLSYLKSLNEMNNYLTNYNKSRTDIIKKINYFNDIFKIIETKKELISKINIIENQINSDLNTLKELSKNLVSINLDIIRGTNVECYIQEYVKINYDISFINDNIGKNNAIKNEMEKKLRSVFNEINIIKNNIITLNNTYINSNAILTNILNISKSVHINGLILKIIKNRTSSLLNENFKDKFIKIFGSFQVYNSILNNSKINENEIELFKEINDDINHYDENIEWCNCIKCNKIKLFKKIYHELLMSNNKNNQQ